MKILFVQNFLPSEPRGGAALLCRDIIQSLNRRNHQIALLTTKTDLQLDNVKIIDKLLFTPKTNTRSDLDSFTYKLKWKHVAYSNFRLMSKIIKDINPDAIYFHNMEWITYTPIAAALKTKKNVVLHAHNHQYARLSTDMNSIKKKRYQSISQLHNARIIVISSFAANRIRQTGFPNKNIFLVYNGLPNNVLSHCKMESPKQDHITIVGAISKHKGTHIAIKAIDEIKKRNVNSRLYIIGESPNPQYLKELHKDVSALNLEQEIIFSGSQKRKDIIQHLQTSEFLFFPSTCDEAFGLVAIEAMANGTIVIGSDRGAIPEVVGDCGFISPPDPVSFAQAVLRARSMSDEATLHLKNKAFERVKELFNLEKNMSSIEAILKG